MFRRLITLVCSCLGYDHPCSHAFRSQVCVQCGVCHC